LFQETGGKKATEKRRPALKENKHSQRQLTKKEAFHDRNTGGLVHITNQSSYYIFQGGHLLAACPVA
jgi:hypothetical protein